MNESTKIKNKSKNNEEDEENRLEEIYLKQVLNSKKDEKHV